MHQTHRKTIFHNVNLARESIATQLLPHKKNYAQFGINSAGGGENVTHLSNKLNNCSSESRLIAPTSHRQLPSQSFLVTPRNPPLATPFEVQIPLPGWSRVLNGSCDCCQSPTLLLSMSDPRAKESPGAQLRGGYVSTQSDCLLAVCCRWFKQHRGVSHRALTFASILPKWA